jgi:hypothetical protein
MAVSDPVACDATRESRGRNEEQATLSNASSRQGIRAIVTYRAR